MKAKSLSALALVALVGAGVAAPSAALAVENPLATEGKIIFTQDEGPSNIVDPEIPGEELVDPDTDPDIVVNPDRGSFSIDAVTKYDFGTEQIDMFTANKVYKAKAVATSNSTGDVSRGHFVQFTDKRAVADHTYQLTANMTAFSNGSSNIDGAFISFANGNLTSATTEAALFPSYEQAFSLNPGVDATTAGASVAVVTNTNAAAGMGVFALEFGTGENGSTTAAESVKLTVPNSNLLTASEYKATVTWTLSDTPLPTPGA